MPLPFLFFLRFLFGSTAVVSELKHQLTHSTHTTHTPVKIKNKEEKIFLWHDRAKILFYKLEQPNFFEKYFFREYIYMIGMHVQIFCKKHVLF
jgi:hypothetical protein